MVTDFSAQGLLIGVKVCTAVWPHLGQVFSHFAEDSPRDGRVMGVNRDHMAGYVSCHSTCWVSLPGCSQILQLHDSSVFLYWVYVTVVQINKFYDFPFLRCSWSTVAWAGPLFIDAIEFCLLSFSLTVNNPFCIAFCNNTCLGLPGFFHSPFSYFLY